MATFDYPNRERSFVRSTVFLLAVAGPSYVAGALSLNTVLPRDHSLALARPIHAAEFSPQDPLLASATVAAIAVDWSRADGGLISQPRECDVALGISTECMFLD